MPFGFEIAGLVGAFQADQASQSGSIASLQAQSGIARVMAGLFAGVIVVIPLEFERAEEALDLERLAALADFPGLGLVLRINPVGRSLEQVADEGGGRFEEGGADEHFQCLHRHPGGRFGGKARH